MGNRAILIFSCDNYADIWPVCVEYFFRQWPDCKLPVYLLTNEKVYDDPRVTSLCVGPDTTWSENAIKALEKIPETQILTLFDDLIFERRVDNEKIMHFFDRAEQEHMDYLRLNPTPAPDVVLDDEIGRVKVGMIYRPSCVYTIWKKDVLLDILDPKENAWEFEVYGPERSDAYENWYAARKWNLPFINLIVKRKYFPDSYRRAKEMGIELPKTREVMSAEDMATYRKQARKERFMYRFIPKRYQRKFQQWGHKK